MKNEVYDEPPDGVHLSYDPMASFLSDFSMIGQRKDNQEQNNDFNQ